MTTLSLPTIPAWSKQAACAKYDPDDWFADNATTRRFAAEVCRDECPVRAECLAYALKNRIPSGIWGGLSEEQRKQRGRRGLQVGA